MSESNGALRPPVCSGPTPSTGASSSPVTPPRARYTLDCPSCDHVATVRDWKDAGAKENNAAFSCVGRWLGADDKHTFRKDGGPCQYAGGGLFQLNPITVTHPDGATVQCFAFAPLEVGATSPAPVPRTRTRRKKIAPVTE